MLAAAPKHRWWSLTDIKPGSESLGMTACSERSERVCCLSQDHRRPQTQAAASTAPLLLNMPKQGLMASRCFGIGCAPHTGPFQYRAQVLALGPALQAAP